MPGRVVHQISFAAAAGARRRQQQTVASTSFTATSIEAEDDKFLLILGTGGLWKTCILQKLALKPLDPSTEDEYR